MTSVSVKFMPINYLKFKTSYLNRYFIPSYFSDTDLTSGVWTGPSQSLTKYPKDDGCWETYRYRNECQ